MTYSLLVYVMSLICLFPFSYVMLPVIAEPSRVVFILRIHLGLWNDSFC